MPVLVWLMMDDRVSRSPPPAGKARLETLKKEDRVLAMPDVPGSAETVCGRRICWTSIGLMPGRLIDSLIVGGIINDHRGQPETHFAI